MTKDEIMVLANKVKEGKATPAEASIFLDELTKNVADLNKFLSTLPKTV